mmetsp:Transcript_19666/g.60829  ORF Transcript_19666/g.60829 Transcript_19666/m.60829 type:complete len:91 (+) Transcript_19666:183-455(+)
MRDGCVVADARRNLDESLKKAHKTKNETPGEERARRGKECRRGEESVCIIGVMSMLYATMLAGVQKRRTWREDVSSRVIVAVGRRPWCWQ